jgi:hypothetical protein
MLAAKVNELLKLTLIEENFDGNCQLKLLHEDFDELSNALLSLSQHIHLRVDLSILNQQTKQKSDPM